MHGQILSVRTAHFYDGTAAGRVIMDACSGASSFASSDNAAVTVAAATDLSDRSGFTTRSVECLRQCMSVAQTVPMPRRLRRHFNRLTPRAITRIDTSSASIDSTDMSTFARGDSGIVSVGLNAVLFVVETYR